MSDIKKNAVQGSKWVSVSAVCQAGIQFVQVAILARILGPEIIGLVAMSNVVIAFVGLFGDLGFSNSIIYKQDTDNRILSTIHYTNVMLGCVLFLVLVLVSPLVADFYDEPRLRRVVSLTALNFIVGFSGAVYKIVLKKELAFKKIAIADICGSMAGIITTVALALTGFRELSIVFGYLMIGLVSTILDVVFGWSYFKPLWFYRFSMIKEHVQFGMFNMGENILNFIQTNWDSIIIGKLLGPKYLGIYNLAYQLAVFPITKFNPIVLQVAYPLIAKFKQTGDSLRKSYIQILDIISVVNFPLLAGLFATVEGVIPIVYGDGWEATFPLIHIFVFVSAISSLSHPLFTIVYSQGKPQYMLYLNLIVFMVKIPLVYVLGHYWHISGVAYALLITTLVTSAVSFYISRMIIGPFIRKFIVVVFKTISICIAMVLAIKGYQLVVGANANSLVHTLIQVALGACIYIGLMLRFKYAFSDVKGLTKYL